MVAKTLAGGKYAVFTHSGSVEFLRMTYQYIWGTWIICSKYEVDLRDDFEYYDERFLGPNNDMSQFNITWIPWGWATDLVRIFRTKPSVNFLERWCCFWTTFILVPIFIFFRIVPFIFYLSLLFTIYSSTHSTCWSR